MSIRLLDSNCENTIDSVSIEYEDSFCLESFGDLCQASFDHSQGKHSFIIARVQTWDHKQPGKAFYSYYNAFHLNKILFQTQVYLGKKLIHRLHVLNPLTNTDIIGNVQYFIVKKSDILNPLPNSILATRFAQDLKTESSSTLFAVEDQKDEINLKMSKPLQINTLVKVHHPAPASATVKQVEEAPTQSWTISGPSVALVTEDITSQDPTYKRRYSILRPVSKSRASVIQDQIVIESTPVSAPTPYAPGDHFSVKRQAASASQVQFPNDVEMGQIERRKQTVNVISKQSSTPLAVNSDIIKVPVPAGIITRFSVPVSTDELKAISPSKKNQRRSLSYANSVITTGRQVSLQDWVDMKKEDHGESNDYDVIKPFGTPMSEFPKRGTSPFRDAPSTIEEDEDVVVCKPVAVIESNTSEFLWDAILFATDTDFLESSKTRLKFKENAIVPEDAMLFKMKEYTGEEEADVEVILEDDLFILDCCYPTAAQLNNSSKFMRVSLTLHRFFTESSFIWWQLCWFWHFLLYILVY